VHVGICRFHEDVTGFIVAKIVEKTGFLSPVHAHSVWYIRVIAYLRRKPWKQRAMYINVARYILSNLKISRYSFYSLPVRLHRSFSFPLLYFSLFSRLLCIYMSFSFVANTSLTVSRLEEITIIVTCYMQLQIAPRYDKIVESSAFLLNVRLIFRALL